MADFLPRRGEKAKGGKDIYKINLAKYRVNVLAKCVEVIRINSLNIIELYQHG